MKLDGSSTCSVSTRNIIELIKTKIVRRNHVRAMMLVYQKSPITSRAHTTSNFSPDDAIDSTVVFKYLISEVVGSPALCNFATSMFYLAGSIAVTHAPSRARASAANPPPQPTSKTLSPSSCLFLRRCLSPLYRIDNCVFTK